MKISLASANPAMVSIFKDPRQMITLDANFIIPPYRRAARFGIAFSKFKTIWLDPIFDTFQNLAIHEAVYDEFVDGAIKLFVDRQIDHRPSKLIIHKDASLTPEEHILRNTIEDLLSPYTNYSPMANNKADCGEVKSLSYMAVKGLIYFAAHDANAIQLIEKSEAWNTGLDQIQAIKMYELIYYLYKIEKSSKDNLRMLYRYQYYLTKTERSCNPEWGEFIHEMEKLYSICITAQ